MILLSTAYFPPIAWFSCLAQEECSIVLAGNYQKQSFRNRTVILSSQGLLDLVIPVLHSGKNKIKEVELSYKENWVRQQARSIETAYRNAPYFEYYWPDIKEVLQRDYVYLFALNEALISLIGNRCGLEMPLINQEWMEIKSGFPDMREQIHPKRFSGVHIQNYTRLFPFKSEDPAKMSILDLLFNKGPESNLFLMQEATLPESRIH